MICVTILTFNSQKYLGAVLDSVAAFDQIVVLDTGSSDQTLHIARQFALRHPNTKIASTSFKGFGPLHNEAVDIADADWILSLDSDEILSPELSSEILQLSLDPCSVYLFRRQNKYRGKWIKGCGWYPDWQTRLFNKVKTRFNQAHVHEAVETQGMKKVYLQGWVYHTPYQSLEDFLAKMQRYTSLWADQQWEKGRKSSPCQALIHGVFAFLRSYILKKGFLLGYEGFLISAYNGHTSFYKYLKLYEKGDKKRF